MSTGTVPKPIAGASNFIDERLGAGNFLKRNLRKVFPDHWSFLLGEIALYSFIILLLTGTFLTLFFKPGMGHVEYQGSYDALKGVMMSEAYASALSISFDVRGGLLMRQMHHWAALLFIGGMMVHALRVFFTGAYRKPRELNWLIGVLLLTLALAEGLTGYSLPDDLLSGAGLRITEGVAISLPLVGTWITFFLFGGEYPGEDVIARFYSLHILLIPGILLALISAHMILMWVQKHTQMPGKGRTNENVVGSPFYPAFMVKAGAYFMFTFGVIAALGTFAQINPIWLFGPYTPADISAGSQPDFYMGFLEGSLRLMPSWEINLFGTAGGTLALSVLIPALVPMGIIMTGLALYPFIEQWVTGDRREHHVVDRPRNNPHRTSIGMAAISFYGVLWLLGANDELSSYFQVSLNWTTYVGRFLVFAAPLVTYIVTYRICLGLQRSDAAIIGHGVESGVIKRLPHGEYIEVHVPPNEGIEAHMRGKTPIPVIAGADADGDGIPPKGMRGPLGKLKATMSKNYGGEKIPLDDGHGDGHGDGHHEEEHSAVGHGGDEKSLTR
ncbi:ubiquinol-cytochrome c reductase cytochrome b subunit [Streptosporangium becharense]|uniref:Cytochrome bc1 complex cytochrome b subunit n=1 Tax=Streptosporangium becharense TaxID=1816182 RepID=A0A7W9MFL4_9ACTN|nr:ubiquinol-cytochrome c reductase cytochrome b subunit [Streptosporangium becharense]MBB2911896.1 ubiquinol-cytochrome c reductase cytochrome b subunit [Streptosporangium becharense]MBB5818443.1 ubiquinol-cytochrome c reductase cytochrome b subunit [Streptosporangium becharense]